MYTVTEVAAEDYDVTYDGCEDIDLAAGAEATCTITNTYNPTPTMGTLTIKKDVIDWADSDIDDNYSFSVTVNGVTKPFSETLDAVFDLVAGEYLVTEGSEVNYSTVSGVGSTTVAVGGNTTITIVNKKNAEVIPTGTITINKTAVNDNGTFTFTIMEGETEVATTSITTTEGSGSDEVVLELGTYSISEGNLEGWTEGALACTAGETPLDESAIVLTDGMDVICNVTNTADVVTPPTPPSNGGGGSSRSGGSRRSSGTVLGASTSTPQVLGAACGLYMDRYLKLGGVNDEVQVIKLQAFLNTQGFFNRVPTAVYDQRTANAVKDFQEKYFNDILKPWGLTAPTGLTYLTTLYKINMIQCPALALKLPPLTPWTGTTNTKAAY